MKPWCSVILFWLCLNLTACVDFVMPRFEDVVEQSMGMPIEKKIALHEHPDSYSSRSGWVQQTYVLDNGHRVYAYPETSRCIVHWEVNHEGIIVGYTSEGKCDF